MNILITGGGGYLGSQLAKTLYARGQRVDLFMGDVSSRDNWLHNIAYNLPDVVIHLAAMTSLRECEQYPERALLVNAYGTQLGASLCSPRTRFIMASTPTVVGYTTDSTPRSEDAIPPLPISVYDHTKYMAELSTLAYGGVVFRMCNIYGPSIADSRKDRGIVNQFVKKGLRGETIPIYRSVANCLRDYTHISDVLEAFVSYVGVTNFHSGVYNVCGGAGHTVQEMADLCGRYEIVDDPVTGLELIEKRSWVGDWSKLNRECGWQPKMTLVQGIVATREAFYGGSDVRRMPRGQ
jgi:UDP-glucose 4-epimerase